MPSSIQARQPGLVSFLDLNTEGRGIQDIAAQLVSTVDLGEFVKLAKRVRVAQSGVAAGGAVGSFAFATSMTVPSAEAWWVHAYTITAVIPVGLTAQLCCTAQMPVAGGNQAWMLGKAESNPVSALASVLACRSEGGILLPPGTILGGITMAISGVAAFTANGFLDYVPIKI